MPTKEKKKRMLLPFTALLALAALAVYYLATPWGFHREVSPEEAALRMSVVETAQEYLGVKEADGSHKAVIDRYNAHQPLAMDYVVTYEDSWCATFVSVVSIQLGLTDILPTECSCERQIGLFQSLNRWEERDSTVPLPGDIIYYDWDNKRLGDCTGWSDHVGIVVSTKWPFIKVIEGNRDDEVAYHYVLVNDIHIRGFGQPDYASMAKTIP